MSELTRAIAQKMLKQEYKRIRIERNPQNNSERDYLKVVDAFVLNSFPTLLSKNEIQVEQFIAIAMWGTA